MEKVSVDIVASLLSKILKGLLVLCILFVTYRIQLHPLREFPGPTGAKITSAYTFWYIWKRTFHLAGLQFHQKYGPVVRVAPNRLMFSSATALNEIYNNPKVTKGQAYVQLRAGTGGTPNMMNTLDKAMHRQKRRIIAPVVSDRSMRIFEPQMSEHVNTFLRLLYQSSLSKDVVNMSPRCERLSVDIVGELAFGYQLNTQTDSTHRAVVEGIKSRGARGTLYYFWPRLRLIDWLLNWMMGSANLERFYKSLKIMINARMALPKDAKHDFFGLASGEISPGEPGFITKDLWAEAVFFIAAGGATTATALSGVFFYLSRNPVAYKRLADEIRTTFADGQEILQGPQLNSCKYLRAVIDETMRLSPSSLTGAWREQDPVSIASGESWVVDGHIIPPGTQVGFNNYTLNHDAKYFPNPFKFQPERWLPPESKADQAAYAAMRHAFAPFSIGERNCAGKPMAYLELSLVVARTIWYLDFTVAPGAVGRLGEGKPGSADGRDKPEEFQLYAGVVVGHEGPNLVFTPRGEFIRELL